MAPRSRARPPSRASACYSSTEADIGSGTSSASSRLIHGGLRYLEHAELGLVYESLDERERLLTAAPHLVEPLELFIPVYARAKRKLWQIGVGLTLYDWLAIAAPLPGHSRLSRDALLAACRASSAPSFSVVQITSTRRFVFPSGSSSRMSSTRWPAAPCVATYADVRSVRVEERRVVGVEWRDAAGAEVFARAGAVVNAAGPWVDRVLGSLPHTRLIGGTKGSHLIVAPFPGRPSAAIYVGSRQRRPAVVHSAVERSLSDRHDGRALRRRPGRRDDRAARDRVPGERDGPRVSRGQGSAERVLFTQTGVRPLPYRAGGRRRRRDPKSPRAASPCGARSLFDRRGQAHDASSACGGRASPLAPRFSRLAADEPDARSALARCAAASGSCAVLGRARCTFRHATGGQTLARLWSACGRDCDAGPRRGARCIRERAGSFGRRRARACRDGGVGPDSNRHSAAAHHARARRRLRLRGRDRCGRLAQAARCLGSMRAPSGRSSNIATTPHATCHVLERSLSGGRRLRVSWREKAGQSFVRSTGSNNGVGRSPRREYRCSLAMSASALSRSSRVLYQCSRVQLSPSRRTKVSPARNRTRMPKGFGTSRGWSRLCAWQMSMTCSFVVGGSGPNDIPAAVGIRTAVGQWRLSAAPGRSARPSSRRVAHW